MNFINWKLEKNEIITKITSHLTEELKKEWVNLAEEKFGAKMNEKAEEIADRVATRGEFLQEVYKEAVKSVGKLYFKTE